MKHTNHQTNKPHTRKGTTANPIAYVIFILITSWNTNASVGDADNYRQYINPFSAHESTQEKAISGWAISFDNDILVPASRDQDYTYGSSLTISGSATRDYPLSLNRPLNIINQFLGIAKKKQTRHSAEFGLYGFTPEDKTNSAQLTDDRPYASIVYWANTQEIATASTDVIWRSTLTLGILGLELVGDIQNAAHDAINSDRANGWQHQISDGGELTARYSIARQRLWHLGNPKIELKTTSQTSLGYITELSWGANLRIGQIHSRWQSYNPELSSYGEHTNQTANENRAAEHYFSIGAAFKVRAYNAFLQGQFRNSAVEYNSDELNHAIFELWAGYTYAFNNGYQISYLLRGHSSEIKTGNGDRTVIWGGLTLSKKY